MSAGDKRCRSCGQPIKWAKTEKGRAMPLNPYPVEGGNIVLVEPVNEAGPAATCYVVAPEAGVERHLSHFATCPSAKAHRRR